MKHFPLTAVALFIATPVLADITAAEAIEAMFDMSRKTGQEITVGERVVEGDTIILRDYHAVQTGPQGAVNMDIDWFRFRNIGDGTVEVTMAPNMSMTMDMGSEYSSEPKIITEMTTDYSLLISGTPDDLIFSLPANDLDMRFWIEGMGGEPDNMEFTITLTQLAVEYHMTNLSDGNIRFHGSGGATGVDFSLDMSDSGSPKAVTMSWHSDDVSGMFDMVVPPLQPGEYYRTGDSKGTSSMSVGESTLNISAEGGNSGNFFAMASFQSMALDSTTTADAILFNEQTRGAVIEVAHRDLPVSPMTFTYDHTQSALTFPLGSEGEPQDYALSILLGGITANEALWALVDPGQTVPRDPANFALDISGQVRMFFNMFDPAEIEEYSANPTTPPVLPVTFNLNSFSLDFAGASLEANGALEFPQDIDMTTPTIPSPIGEISVSIEGVQTLMTKLGALPAIPAQATMGIMGMMGMFTRPTGEVDSVETVIEFTEGNGITVNGMRVQ